MDNENELRVMHAELCDRSDNLPILDPHGFTKEHATDEARQFLSHQIFTGASCCRIVHGKGSGVVAGAVKKEIGRLIKEKQEQYEYSCS